ncbi:hypothetical protein [Methylorubrum zatmanii]
MSRILTVSALALSLAAGLTGAASAQSYNAPAGIPAVAAPGGLNATAGSDTVRYRAERAGQSAAVAVEGVEATGSIHHRRSAR